MQKVEKVNDLVKLIKTRDQKSFEIGYESLLKRAKRYSKDYIELIILWVNYEYLFIGDFVKLFNYTQSIEDDVLKYGDKQQKIKFLTNKGIVLSRLNKTDQAIDLYKELLEICKDDDMKISRVGILTNIGVAYSRQQDYIKSLRYFLEAYQLNLKIESNVKITTLLVNIGSIYLNLELFDKAIYYFELALKTVVPSREYTKPVIYTNLVTTYSLINDFDNAERIIELLEEYKDENNKAFQVSYHKAIINYYSQKKMYKSALQEFDTVIELQNDENYAQQNFVFKLDIAKIYLKMGQADKCLQIFDEIEWLRKKSGFPEDLKQLLELKLEYNKHIGNLEKALELSLKLNNVLNDDFKMLQNDLIENNTRPVISNTSDINQAAYDDKIHELEEINSELHVKERLLVESLNDLSYESKLREKFISIISHDIRAPLGNIIQLLDMFNEQDDQLEKEEILLDVMDAMKQTYLLANELVNWSKEVIETEISNLEPVNVYKIVGEIESLFKNQLTAKNLVLVNSTRNESLILSHETSIKTCFRNIIQNAIKYSEPYNKIEVNQFEDEDFVIYSIKDSGQGMTQEQVDNLFNTGKISTLGTNEEKGIGIGLILVKELVVKNKGEISCSSTLGLGTNFELRFPKKSLNSK